MTCNHLFCFDDRTPLNTVQMGLQLILDNVKDHIAILKRGQKADHGEGGDEYEKIEEMLTDTFGCCNTAVDILNDILTYDKLEGGDIKMNVSTTTAPSLIEAACRPFKVQASQIGVELKYQGPNHIHASLVSQSLEVDEKRMCQVLRNVLSNALKFTPRGGSIKVYAYPCDSYDDVKSIPRHTSAFEKECH